MVAKKDNNNNNTCTTTGEQRTPLAEIFHCPEVRQVLLTVNLALAVCAACCTIVFIAHISSDIRWSLHACNGGITMIIVVRVVWPLVSQDPALAWDRHRAVVSSVRVHLHIWWRELVNNMLVLRSFLSTHLFWSRQDTTQVKSELPAILCSLFCSRLFRHSLTLLPSSGRGCMVSKKSPPFPPNTPFMLVSRRESTHSHCSECRKSRTHTLGLSPLHLLTLSTTEIGCFWETEQDTFDGKGSEPSFLILTVRIGVTLDRRARRPFFHQDMSCVSPHLTARMEDLLSWHRLRPTIEHKTPR